jgi:spermidine synthase
MTMTFVKQPVKASQRLILGLFFVSGISGLLYEVAWTRMLHLLFGDTVLAVSTVLVSFMAGLALGSFWSGRYVDQRTGVLGLYAVLEAALGLSAMLVPLALQALTPVYVWIHQQLYPAVFLLSLARFLLAFCLLAVPTTLMGATLPVLSRYVVRTTWTLGWHVGVLYGLNTGGAVVGCFAAGYLLIGHLGLYQTVALGAALNLAIALVVWAMRQRAEAMAPVTTEPDDARIAPHHDATPVYEASTVRLVLGSMALSGMAALAYEVIWTRALTFFIGNSTYAFSAMLTTFLAGLAIGSLLLARLSDRQRHLLTLLGGLHVAIGVYGLLTIPILGYVFYGLDTWWQGFSRAYWDTPVWLTFIKTFVVIFPPTLCLGGLFPVASKIVVRGPQTIARSVGNIYALNTLGAIVGAWISGFVALPLLGMRTSLVATALVSVGIGGAFLMRQRSVRWHLQLGVLAGVAGVFVAVIVGAPILRFADIAGEPEKALLYYDEGVAGVVKVATDVYDRKLLSINGWSVAGTGTPSAEVALVNDYPEIQKLLAHLPMLLHAAPQRVLIVGFGAGGTAWSMSRYDDLEHLDIVEFVPGVIRAARFFPEVNHNVLTDPRLRVILDDGRHYLLVTPQTYDVISVDTLDPKHAGNGNLYTREFYELSKQALRPGGLFVQWLPYHQVDNTSLKLIARTFQHVYPHATLWLNRFKGYTLLLGSREPLRIDVAQLAERFHRSAVQHDLAEVHVATPWQFLEGFTMRADTLRRYTAGETRLNSYNHPYVEFYGTSWHDPVEENLAELAWFADDVTPLLEFATDFSPQRRQEVLARLEQQRRISHYIFQGYLANWRRQLQAGTRAYRKALKLDPDDEGVKFALGVSTRHKEQALEALAHQPDDTKALSKLGYIAWNEQQYDEAVRYFQRVLEIDPNNAAAYIHLGVNYVAQERFEASITAYREAERLNPDFAELVAQSIQLVQYQQRAAVQPDDLEVHWQLGLMYSADGRSDRAIEAFERVTALAPHFLPGFLQLARNYEAEGRDSEAMHAYSRVLEIEPVHVQARNNYEKLAIKMALERGEPASVRLDTENVLEIDASSASSYYHLGLRYLRNDEPEAAAVALHQAVQLHPEHNMAYLFLGLAYATSGAHAKAEAAYRQAIALSPNRVEAYYYLGSLYQQQQRYRKAIKAYRRVIAQTPENAMAYANLGASYEALGKRTQALTAYRQAWQRDASLGFVRDKINALSQP